MESEIDNDWTDMMKTIDDWSKSHFLGDCIVDMVNEDESNDRSECTVRVRWSDFDCIDLWRWCGYDIG